MMEPYLLCESSTKYPQNEKVLERLLHVIWSEQLFRKVLQVDGKELKIFSPGWWNLEAGPDFRNAELFIEGQRICGDVEIHLNSSDWYVHKHHEDPRYNGVVLHVVLYKSLQQCVTQDGRILPELELKNCLLEELRLLQNRIPVYQFPFGPEVNVRLCRRFLEEQDERAVLRILDSAGDLRMRRKKERFLQQLRETGFDQTFYAGMMEAMGYKQSRFAFRELSNRVPIEELLQQDLPGRKGIDSMAAILMGTAGLLSDFSQTILEPPDRETALYLDQLFQHWRKVRDRFQSRILTGFVWYPSSTRPANFPARRLTSIAAFFHYYKNSFQSLLMAPLAEHQDNSGKVLHSWMKLFSTPLHIYWSYHFQFDGKKFVAPRRLIGTERIRILIVNVIIPVLLAYAELTADNQLEQLLHSLYRSHPKLAENSITRLMLHRLFGSARAGRKWICTAHRQQALHHFFYDFCDNRESSCSRCELKTEKAAREIMESIDAD